MKRYFNEDDNFFNNNNNNEEHEEIEYELDEEVIAFINKSSIEETINLNQELLLVAIDLAHEKFLWKFKTVNTQINIIKRIYFSLLELRDIEPEPKEK